MSMFGHDRGSDTYGTIRNAREVANAMAHWDPKPMGLVAEAQTDLIRSAHNHGTTRTNAPCAVRPAGTTNSMSVVGSVVVVVG